MTAFTFGVPVDRASYVIPTAGIAMLGATVAAVPMFILGEYVGTQLAMGGIAVAAVGSAVWWVRRRYRIHHERQIVIDREGVSYFAFSTRRRLIPWATITRIVESPSHNETDGYLIDVYSSSRRLRIDQDAFIGYDTIKSILRTRLPDRSETIASSGLLPDAERAVRDAVKEWTSPLTRP